MEDILNKITAFADDAHGEQTRKYTPERYIVHPVRVMRLCQEYTQDLPILAAALLHDVLEDTPVSKAQIVGFLSSLMSAAERDRTIGLVVELTDIYTKQNFPQWNRRKRKQMEAGRIAAVSADAQTIKYADILDNSVEIAQQDPAFGKRFLQEVKNVLEQATRGNAALRERAVKLVSSELVGL